MAACGRADPETELDSASASFLAGDHRDAAVRLNYVVKMEPDNARARELRGDVSLFFGDFANAASDFRLAQELGTPLASVALGLAEAQLGQRQFDKALELLRSVESAVGDEPLYWTLRTEALLGLDRLSEAEDSFAEIQRVGDGGIREMLVGARIAFERGDTADAFDLLGQALAIAPNDARVRIAHAELLASENRLSDAARELQLAADIYRDARVRPREIFALFGLVQLHLALNDLGAAETVAERLVEVAPQAQLTSYFQGLVASRRGQFDEAAALIQPLVGSSPETIQYRSLLGAIHLGRGNLGQAEQQFLRVLSISPGDPAAAKLLAETRLRQQRPDAALDALLTIQDAAADDPQIGLLTGIATLLSGDAEQGLLYLEEAAARDPTNESLKLQLARAYLAAGRDAEASRILVGSFGNDARAIEAKLLRLFADGRRDNVGSAMEVAEELVADYPDDPLVLTAVAVHFQFNGETGRARELFEQAAEFDSGGATARLFVAESLAQEGRQDDAEQLLRQAVLDQPENAQAIAGLAQLLASRGALEEAAELFGRAAEHTSSVMPRLALVQTRLRQGRLDEAKRQLETATSVAPDNPEVLALRGKFALSDGQFGDAAELLERAASLLPQRLDVTIALARARIASGQADAARDTLLQALNVAPRSYPLLLALGDTELQRGNAQGALSVATDLKVEYPSQSGGYVLEGKALIATRQYAAASKSLAAAFEKQPTWRVLAFRVEALRLAGESEEALDSLESWVDENPNHVPAALIRAVLLQTEGRSKEALEAYRALLQVEPDNVVALNNAAWIAHELAEPDALSFAERAYEVGPEVPSVLDTFGWILLGQGKGELAIEKLSRAVELAPQAPEIRYHLAQALSDNGQSSQAREILEALLNEERDFAERADAERLLESI
jgi:putative PEP-CTERM system TPR-repeat lipoprotein